MAQNDRTLKFTINGVEKAFKDFEELKKEIESTEEALKSATNPEEILQFRTAITQLEKAMELYNKQAEAAALATDDLGQEIFKAQKAIEKAEAQAKLGIFPPGSIGAITAELELLELELQQLDPASDAFIEAKKKVEQLNLVQEELGKSAIQRQEEYFQLGQSIIGTFGNAVGAIQLFAGENEELAQVLETVAKVQTLVAAGQEALALAQQLSAKAAAANAVAVNGTSTAVSGLGTAIKVALGPIGLIIAALSAIAVGTVAVIKHLDAEEKQRKELSKQYKEQNDAILRQKNLTKELDTEVVKELATFDALFKSLQKTTAGTNERKAVVQQLVDQYPKYLEGINLEKAGQEELIGVYTRVRDALLQNIRAKAASLAADKIIQENQDVFIKQAQQLAAFQKELALEVKLGNITQIQAQKLLQSALGNTTESVNELFKSFGGVNSLFTDSGSSGGGIVRTANELRTTSTEVNRLTEDLQFLFNVAGDTADVANKKIETLNRNIQFAIGNLGDIEPDLSALNPPDPNITTFNAYYEEYERLGKEVATLNEELTNTVDVESRKQLQIRISALEKQRRAALDAFNGVETAVEQSEAKITQLTKEQIDERARLEEEARKARVQQAVDTTFQIAQGVLDVFSSLNDMLNQQSQLQQEKLMTLIDEQKNIQSELDSELDNTRSKIDELTGNLANARAEQTAGVLASIKAQQEQEKKLQKEKEASVALEKKLDEERKALALKEFQRTKALNLAQAIVSIAQGISMALGSSPPPANFVLAGLTGVAGAVQIATISQQQPPRFAEGGFTKKGDKYEPAGIVDAGEWVAPQWMVSSPSFSQEINSLEMARKRGFADGGFTTPQSVNVEQVLANQNKLIEKAIDLSDRPVVVSVQDINSSQDEVRRVQARASF